MSQKLDSWFIHRYKKKVFKLQETIVQSSELTLTVRVQGKTDIILKSFNWRNFSEKIIYRYTSRMKEIKMECWNTQGQTTEWNF